MSFQSSLVDRYQSIGISAEIPTNYTEIDLILAGIRGQVVHEFESYNIERGDSFGQLVIQRLDRLNHLLHVLDGDHKEYKEPPLVLQTVDQDHPIDQLDIMEAIAGHPDMEASAIVLYGEYLARILYNQSLYDQESLETMRAQSIADNRHMSRVMFAPYGDHIYTDNARTREMYGTIIKALGLNIPGQKHLIAGVGSGDTELRTLRDAGIPARDIIATDLLPIHYLGDSNSGLPSLIQSLSKPNPEGRVKFFGNREINDTLYLLMTRFGPFLREISSLGSSLVNHKNAALMLNFFYLANLTQVPSGVLTVESRSLETRPENNEIFQAAIKFGEKNPTTPFGTKGILPQYAHDGQSDQDRGPWIQSHTVFRGLALLNGYQFVSPVLQDTGKAINYIVDPQSSSHDPIQNPIWSPRPGNERIFLTMQKTNLPHPLARALLKYYYRGFSHRFPALAKDQPSTS